MKAPSSSRPALPPALVRSGVVVGLLAAALTVALGFAVADGSTATAADRWAEQGVAVLWPNPGEVAYAIDFIGEPQGVVTTAVVLAAVCAALGGWRLAVVALVSPFLTGLVTTVGKLAAGRTIHGDNLSYPSGHVGVIAALVAVAALLILGRRPIGRAVGAVIYVGLTVAAAAVMALDQVAIAAHYPLDTVGGLGTALAVVAGTAVAVDRCADAVGTWRDRRAPVTRQGEPVDLATDGNGSRR